MRCLAERGNFGTLLGSALDALFAVEPHVRGYILDERGALRKHVCIFADGVRLPLSGRWRVQIDILVSDFEKISIEDDVDLPR